MKKLKVILLGMTALMTASVIVGCGETTVKESQTENSSSTDSESNADTTSEQSEEEIETSGIDQSDTKADDFTFTDVADLIFYYSSGAGGWCTELYINEDGTFSGNYHDSDMGDTGDDYPNGTYYVSDFTGSFSTLEKVNDNTYSTTIDSISVEKEVGTEEIIDGTKYVYSDPYGVDNAGEILIYLPGASLSELPEDYLTWVGYYDLSATTDTELPFYGIYNVNTKSGFSSYSNSDTTEVTETSIEEELATVAQSAADLEDKLENEATTQSEMTELSSEIFTVWDDELNTIWTRLTDTLDDATMETIKAEEKEWITEKETAVEEAGAEYEGGSMQPMAENMKAAELTKERVYELASYLR